MMYWGIMYGVIAGFILVVINLLSQYIAVIWFPVFLAGVIWGGYRNYIKQKKEAGSSIHKSVVEEFKSAAQDVVEATGEMLAENREAAEEVDNSVETGTTIEVENEVEPTTPKPPENPTPPAAPNPPQS